MKHILTVCVGNICRSPLAEVLLAHKLPQHRVWSAGLAAVVGAPADPLSQQIAIEHGLDLSTHSAQQVTAPMCQLADLILVMEQNHKDWLEQQYPQLCGKVFPLGQFGGFEIADPYRQPREAFDTAFTAIRQGVADWAPRIRQLSA